MSSYSYFDDLERRLRQLNLSSAFDNSHFTSSGLGNNSPFNWANRWELDNKRRAEEEASKKARNQALVEQFEKTSRLPDDVMKIFNTTGITIEGKGNVVLSGRNGSKQKFFGTQYSCQFAQNTKIIGALELINGASKTAGTLKLGAKYGPFIFCIADIKKLDGVDIAITEMGSSGFKFTVFSVPADYTSDHSPSIWTSPTGIQQFNVTDEDIFMNTTKTCIFECVASNTNTPPKMLLKNKDMVENAENVTLLSYTKVSDNQTKNLGRSQGQSTLLHAYSSSNAPRTAGENSSIRTDTNVSDKGDAKVDNKSLDQTTSSSRSSTLSSSQAPNSNGSQISLTQSASNNVNNMVAQASLTNNPPTDTGKKKKKKKKKK